MGTSTAPTDVITFLIDQHQEVAQMFLQLEKMDGATDGEAQRLAEQVVTSLVEHSVAEEIYLYPTARKVLPGGDDIAEHEINEHNEAEQTMKRLEALTPDQPEFWPTMRTLISEIRHHVAEEENSLFPKLRAACSEEQLRELGRKAERVQKISPTRPHPASPSEGAALALVAPGAGLVDRVRDALSGRGR